LREPASGSKEQDLWRMKTLEEMERGRREREKKKTKDQALRDNLRDFKFLGER